MARAGLFEGKKRCNKYIGEEKGLNHFIKNNMVHVSCRKRQTIKL